MRRLLNYTIDIVDTAFFNVVVRRSSVCVAYRFTDKVQHTF